MDSPGAENEVSVLGLGELGKPVYLDSFLCPFNFRKKDASPTSREGTFCISVTSCFKGKGGGGSERLFCFCYFPSAYIIHYAKVPNFRVVCPEPHQLSPLLGKTPRVRSCFGFCPHGPIPLKAPITLFCNILVSMFTVTTTV